MAAELKFKQIAAVVRTRPGAPPGGVTESLRLYGLTEEGAVYEYIDERTAGVEGGAWKKMSMRELL